MHVLTGARPNAQASYTCRTPQGASVVDLVLGREAAVCVSCDDDVLHTLSDHTVQLATIPISDRLRSFRYTHAQVTCAGAGAGVDAGARAGASAGTDVGASASAGASADVGKVYRWEEGTSVHDYADAEIRWKEYTNTAPFATALLTVV